MYFFFFFRKDVSSVVLAENRKEFHSVEEIIRYSYISLCSHGPDLVFWILKCSQAASRNVHLGNIFGKESSKLLTDLVAKMWNVSYLVVLWMHAQYHNNVFQ